MQKSISSRRSIEEIDSISESQIQSLYSISKSKDVRKTERVTKSPTRNELLEYIKTRGLVDDMQRYLIGQHPLDKPIIQSTFKFAEDTYLQVKVEVMKGKDFTDYEKNVKDKAILCSIATSTQRFVIESTQASTKPEFNKEFTFKMRKSEKFDLEEVMRENEPLNLVLIEKNNKTKKQVIISTKRIEWRHILHCKSIEQEILLTRMDLYNKNPLGTLNVTFI